MTELQTNRYDALLRRVGDLKGPGSKVNDVLQELFPTLDVENVPGELLFLMGTRVGWAATSKVPTAGKRSGIQLFNPVGSGQLLTVSTVLLSATGASTIAWGTTTTPFATNTGIPRLRDTRVGVNAQGISELRTSVDALPPTQGTVTILGKTVAYLEDGNSVCILGPGTGMSVVGTTDVNLFVSFTYRERVAEPSELSF